MLAAELYSGCQHYFGADTTLAPTPETLALVPTLLRCQHLTFGKTNTPLLCRARRGRSGEWDIAVAAAATLGFFVYACFFWTY